MALTPLAATLVSSAKSAAVSKVQAFVKQKVIERWSRYRAERFFESFLDEVAKQADDRYQSASLDDLLDRLDAEDESTSTLFDAYRRVCLSASRDVGPRIIGLLTAVVVLENRSATGGEERMFQAAELLTDADFAELVEYTRAKQEKLSTEQGEQFAQHGYVSYVVDERVDEVKTTQGHFASVSPPNLGEVLGIWGLRLNALCLIYEDRRERFRIENADSERYRDEDMHVRTITDYVVTTREYHRLVALAERAIASL
ncbi:MULTISPECIES: hypothetical protein [unclassified Paraburkholderia]|uniref:hypothetical protein n=1 Tax=unclassified Paraburkholderia TaxID=2615204 RepID=UPI002AB23563|nr:MULTISPECIES: hypothetical protein [unclassified Paraburkholderia]